MNGKVYETEKVIRGRSQSCGAEYCRIKGRAGYSPKKDFISKIQTMGVDINPTSYSKLEGQFRIATDKEIFVIAKLLDVDIKKLFR